MQIWYQIKHLLKNVIEEIDGSIDFLFLRSFCLGIPTIFKKCKKSDFKILVNTPINDAVKRSVRANHQLIARNIKSKELIKKKFLKHVFEQKNCLWFFKHKIGATTIPASFLNNLHLYTSSTLTKDRSKTFSASSNQNQHYIRLLDWRSRRRYFWSTLLQLHCSIGLSFKCFTKQTLLNK